MQYPLYVHRDGDTGFRASFPDLPRAVACGHSFDELKRNAQEVVELMYDRSEQLIPAPTCSTSELQSLDMDDGRGIWMFIEINLARVTSKAVSVQFSLPESLRQRVDAAAKERHLTRSMFIALAAVHELENRYEGQLSCTPVSRWVFVDG
ncbi:MULTISPECIES: type II toxin-antitoxin system HicB family antitoxin [unclassified Paraburkholderia]|uniref:type II toxin-antitoxin system HicB family antitoxin n=1 Tax=unclassified Paraburkholderia TaxID=2615204 RepID=UPI00161A34AE|nr:MULTISPECIES: type II toxin-antitoxin system HicB family antitoxin [unclassified Paraburkholderia]MBB5441418.1 putative RNase H-like HicB family nuclease [Paraburkholderia sp. WSM4177]MBB5481813.1 putative RNase H-like HicB family nuclease [Paraburkholderia sp. WSM4180]